LVGCFLKQAALLVLHNPSFVSAVGGIYWHRLLSVMDAFQWAIVVPPRRLGKRFYLFGVRHNAGQSAALTV
jgi:hypothetical protein